MGILGSILLYLVAFGSSAALVGYGYKKKNIVLQIIGLLIPILLCGLRFNVGIDYPSYLDAYADITNPQVVDRYGGTTKLEPTFYLISYLSYFIFSNPIAIFVTYSAVTVFAFYKSLTLMKPKYISIALFFFYSIFFLNSFNIMRQGAAISLGCLAISYYINGQKMKATLYFLIAFAFHSSAIALIIFLISERFIKKKFKMKNKKFTPIFSITVILSLLIATLGLKIAAVGSFIYSVTGRIGVYNPGISAGILFKYLICLACIYLVIYTWKYFNEKQKELSIFVSLGLVVYSLGLVYNEAGRFGTYLIALTPILYAITFDHINLGAIRIKVLLNLGIVLLCAYYVISVNLVTDGSVRYMYQAAPSSDAFKNKLNDLEI